MGHNFTLKSLSHPKLPKTSYHLEDLCLFSALKFSTSLEDSFLLKNLTLRGKMDFKDPLTDIIISSRMRPSVVKGKHAKDLV